MKINQHRVIKRMPYLKNIVFLFSERNARYQAIPFLTENLKNNEFDIIITSGKLISSDMMKVSEIKIPKLFTSTRKKDQIGDKLAGIGCHAILISAISIESLFNGIHSAFYNFERDKNLA